MAENGPILIAYDGSAGAKAAVVVIGSRGHSGIKSALLGSVSHGVASHCRRPVLLVRGDH